MNIADDLSVVNGIWIKTRLPEVIIYYELFHHNPFPLTLLAGVSTIPPMKEGSRRILYLLLRILASTLLLVFLLWRVDLAQLRILFSSVRFLPLAMGLLAWFSHLLLLNLRWRRLLVAQDIRLPYFRLLVYYMISFFFNNFLPAGLGMDITRTVYVAKENKRGSEVFASVLTERVLGMVGILIFALLALMFYLNTPEGRIFALLILGTMILTAAVIALFLRRGFLPGIRRRIASIRVFKLGERTRHFYEAMQLYRKRGRSVLWAIFLSLFVQGFLVLINYTAGLSLGLDLPLYSHLVYVPIISIIAIIPISINGIGVREWGYVFLFGMAGLTSGEALSLSLLFFAVGIVGSLSGGIAFLVRR